jgi:NADPH2:quinone reductase
VNAFAESPLEAIEKQLELVPMQAPKADELGPRDIVVAVKSAAVGWVDLLMTSGQYQHLPKPPYCRAGVRRHRRGGRARRSATASRLVTRSSSIRSMSDRAPGASTQTWEAFASYAVGPVDAALPVPRGLSLDQACNLLGNYETAYHCLVARGRLQAGETVARPRARPERPGSPPCRSRSCIGATVIATGRSKEKLAVASARTERIHVIAAAEGAEKSDVADAR